MVLIGMLYSPFARETVVPFYRTKVFYASTRIALGFLILVAAGYAFAPDWMWMYFLPAQEVGAAMTVVVVIVLYLLPYAMGLYINARLVESSWSSYLICVAICIGAQAALIVSLWPRYSKVGTMEEFINGTAQSLSSAQPVGSVLTAGAFVLGAVAWLQWRTFRHTEIIEKTRGSGESKKIGQASKTSK